MHGPEKQPDPFDAVLERVEQERRRLSPLLPDMDPGDLHSIFQPWGMGRTLFVRKLRPGVYGI